MKKAMMHGAMVLILAASGCDAPLDPTESTPSTPAMHVGSPASSCPLAPMPPSAHVLLCFPATLQPGVWHGWIVELSVAQPPGAPGGAFDRTRLNHAYMLASPQGYTRLGPNDPVTPPVPNENAYAFQAEFNGSQWFDVLRLHAAANGGPQSVSVVVFWVDAAGVATDIRAAVSSLLASGVVNSGQANALMRKIDQALNLHSKGFDADAIAVLEGFIQQVNDLTHVDFVLSPSQAEPLLVWAQLMIDSI